ncbi:MAG: Ig-like domain-containing protein, partial [Patescibacteria group bacterium]
MVTAVDSNSLDLTTGATLEAWVFPTVTPSGWNGSLIAKETTSKTVYSLFSTSPDFTAPTFILDSVGQKLTAGPTLPVNTWSHVAGTYNGTTMRLYVNGVERTSSPETALIGVSTGNLAIGGNSIWGEYFQGRIDEIRIYNTVRTATEISTDMNTSITGAPAGDTTNPTVTIDMPTGGSTVSGTAVAVSATATDAGGSGVAGVQFRVDGTNLGAEDTTSPYAVTWNTTTATNGSHTLTAIARDGAGNSATSLAVTVTVSNADITPPTVSITSPSNGATLTSPPNISINATASDTQSGILDVQFQLDGANFGLPDTVSPYSTTWDTLTATNGSHSLTAIARDNASTPNSATSPARTVTVDNPGRSNPGPVGSVTSGSSVTISLTTAVNATCQWNTTGGIAFGGAGMTAFSTTGLTSHSHTVGILTDGVKNYFVRCQSAGATPRTNLSDFQISFSVGGVVAGGPCTDGVDCYCDRVRNISNPIYDPNLRLCEDFEAVTLHED